MYAGTLTVNALTETNGYRFSIRNDSGADIYYNILGGTNTVFKDGATVEFVYSSTSLSNPLAFFIKTSVSTETTILTGIMGDSLNNSRIIGLFSEANNRWSTVVRRVTSGSSTQYSLAALGRDYINRADIIVNYEGTSVPT